MSTSETPGPMDALRCRVVLIVPTMERGGAEKQVCLLAEHLPKQQFDVHVVLLTRGGPLLPRLQEAVTVHQIGKAFKADPRALFKLQRLLRQLRPDVVHTFLFAANSFGRYAAHRVGVPHIIASERCVDPWKRMWHGVIDRFLARRSACITTNSTGVRDFYTRRGIDADLFRIISNGIAPRNVDVISRQEAFQRLEVPPSRHLFLAVGRLWPQKRYRDLIWSGELMGSMRGDTTLVIIGDGPKKHALMRFRDSVTSPLHVRFAGHRTDVAQLLPHASQFWVGSAYEGQSNALMEAMQAGLPVVASDIPGNRDLITHETHGLLFPLGDRVAMAKRSQRLLEDPALAQHLASAARERIETEFTIQQMVEKHATLYSGLQEETPVV